MAIDTNPHRDALHQRLRALVFGQVDMWETFATARYLRGDDPEARDHHAALPLHVRRTLETGMLVTYARPFVESRGRARLRASRDLPQELRASHGEILNRRNKVYAHSDETSLRRLLELSTPSTTETWLRGEANELNEEWHPPAESMLLDLLSLAQAHFESFSEEMQEVRVHILADS